MENDVMIKTKEDVAKLFSPVKVGQMELTHRVVMAPLTRMRSDAGNIPGDLMVEYYTQRATNGGLIISEATPVSLRGYGYAKAPGIYADEQIAGWKKVTDAIHSKGGYIYLQLWHVGRQSHYDLQPNGDAPVAPSALKADGYAYSVNGAVPFIMPRALEIEEIPGIIEAFRLGARRALAAGFDGVELHGANGYLPDQFLQDGTNKRTDAYGGPVENRARFMLEIMDALVSVWGDGRVGIRLAPSGTYGSMSDSDPIRTFGYVAEQLNKYNLSYLHVVEPRIKGIELVSDDPEPIATEHLRKIFKGPIITAGGYNRNSAEAVLENGYADLVAFGRYFISNPDLPERLRRDLRLNPYNRDTFYGGGREGYTDYPFLAKRLFI